MIVTHPNLFFPPPVIQDGKAPGIRRPVNLSGTGTTEAVSAKLIVGRRYFLLVGATAVLVAFSGVNNTSNLVTSTTGTYFPANAIFPFTCIKNVTDGWSSEYCYMEAADGSSAFTASILCVD